MRAYAHCGAPHIRAVPCCAVAWLALPCGAVLCDRHRAVMSALWSLEPSRFRYGRFGDDDVIAWDDSNVEGPPKVCHPYSLRRAPVHVLWYNLHPTPVTTSTFRARDDGGAGPARLRRPDRSHLSCSVQRTPMMQHATYTCHTARKYTSRHLPPLGPHGASAAAMLSRTVPARAVGEWASPAGEPLGVRAILAPQWTRRRAGYHAAWGTMRFARHHLRCSLAAMALVLPCNGPAAERCSGHVANGER